MDTLVFPYSQGVAYNAVNRAYWKEMTRIFPGFEIKRTFNFNPLTKQLEGGDNLIKTWINVAEDVLVYR